VRGKEGRGTGEGRGGGEGKGKGKGRGRGKGREGRGSNPPNRNSANGLVLVCVSKFSVTKNTGGSVVRSVCWRIRIHARIDPYPAEL